MDLIDDPQPGGNAHEYTVSEISGAVKRVIEGEFGRVRVRGEVGRVFAARSGHLYFDIKDDRNVLASVAWKGQVGALTARPEEGMEVVAVGRLTTFGSQSKYQLTVDDLRPAGVGALMAMLEKRKAALQAEGLFAAERKRALPFLPQVIGVVTSPSGAVIRDILHRLADRFPRHVVVWPVAVQGRDCAPQVARAIAGFNAMPQNGPIPRPDLLIVARGGGSVEDLWGFNEEIVARAAADSVIPLISAVGHETDTTLIDHVSDFRAPTPSAAAERAVPVRMDSVGWAEDQGLRARRALGQGVVRRRQRLGDLARGLPRPEALTRPARQRLDGAERALPAALRGVAQQARGRLVSAAAVLRPATLRARLAEARGRLTREGARLAPALNRRIRDERRQLDARAGQLSVAAGRRLDLTARRRHLSDIDRRLTVAGRAAADRRRERLAGLERLLETLGYKQTLARGYAVVRAGDGIVTTAAEARAATALEIEFADARVPVVAGPAPARPRRKKDDTPPEQGSLL